MKDTVKSVTEKFIEMPVHLVGNGIDAFFNDVSEIPEEYYDYTVEKYLAFQKDEPFSNGKTAGVEFVIS